MFASILISAAEEVEPNGYWLPHDLDEVIWGSIAFFIVLGLLGKYALPFIRKAMEDRTTQIGNDLGAAESLRNGAESERDEIKAALADSDTEAARIVEEARQAADALGKEIRQRGEADAAEITARIETDVATATRQAVADMTAEVGRLALGAAQEVVTSNLDDSTQQRLIDDYISQLGSQN